MAQITKLFKKFLRCWFDNLIMDKYKIIKGAMKDIRDKTEKFISFINSLVSLQVEKCLRKVMYFDPLSKLIYNFFKVDAPTVRKKMV